MNKKYLILGAVGFFLVAGIAVTLILLKSSQDNRSRAQAFPTPIPTSAVATTTSPSPSGTAQINDAPACPAPAAVSNVFVDYPNCEGVNCSFSEASCQWDASSDATTYNVTITEVETNTQVKQESLASSVVKTVFPVTNGKTYKCDVSAVNTCGAISTVASHQLLCVTDVAVSPTATPVPPTPTPTLEPTPTNTPVPTTAAPTVTIAKPGGYAQTIGILGGVLLALIGGILLLTL